MIRWLSKVLTVNYAVTSDAGVRAAAPTMMCYCEQGTCGVLMEEDGRVLLPSESYRPRDIL